MRSLNGSDLLVVFTGTEETNRRFLKLLKHFSGLSVPLIRIAPISSEIEEFKRCVRVHKPDLLVFTSKTAVNLVKKLADLITESALMAIGPGTADSLRRIGARSVLMPVEHTSAGLLRILSGLDRDLSVQLVSSAKVNEDLANIVEEFREGRCFRLYDIEPDEEGIRRLQDLGRCAVVLTCGTAAKAFRRIRENHITIAMSPRIADILGDADFVYKGGTSEFVRSLERFLMSRTRKGS